MRAEGYVWNHKRVYRVYCAMRLNLKRKAKRRLITRESQPLLTGHELNRVWALDFMRDTLYDGRPFRTLDVFDEGNREALRIECGTSIPSSRVVRVMDQLIEVYGKPEAVRLNNGPELTADVFVDWAEKHKIRLLYVQPGKPNQNAFVERFNRRFREEVLDAWLFNAVSEVQEAADGWMVDYNECRPHESLGNVPPAVFRPRVFDADVSTSGLSTCRGSLRPRGRSARFAGPSHQSSGCAHPAHSALPRLTQAPNKALNRGPCGAPRACGDSGHRERRT